jgi:hypothetical protein
VEGICGSAELKIALIVNRQSVQGLAPHWQGALNQAMAPGGAMAGAQPTQATFRLHMFRMKNTRWPQTNHPPQHHSTARDLHQCTNSCCRGIWHASLPFSFLLNHAVARVFRYASPFRRDIRLPIALMPTQQLRHSGS